MFNTTQLLLIIGPLLLSLGAQFLVSSTFKKYSKIKTRRNLSGEQAAEILLRANSISNVKIEGVRGSLTDHYDPTHKVLRLSEPVYRQTSIAAVGVAAHETGHAVQDKLKYGPLILRGTLVPAAQIGSSMGPYLAIAGIIFSIQPLLTLGIVLFSMAVIFYLITLPVEIDASRRALKILESNGILADDELVGVKKVLTAAALTYVAAAITAVAQLLRFILLSRRK